MQEQRRADVVPPAPIRDLVARRTEQGTVLRFSAPVDAVRYHVVWGDKPVVAELSTDPSELNWWAANALPAPAAAGAGAQEQIRIPDEVRYAAVFSFDVPTT